MSFTLQVLARKFHKFLCEWFVKEGEAQPELLWSHLTNWKRDENFRGSYTEFVDAAASLLLYRCSRVRVSSATLSLPWVSPTAFLLPLHCLFHLCTRRVSLPLRHCLQVHVLVVAGLVTLVALSLPVLLTLHCLFHWPFAAFFKKQINKKTPVDALLAAVLGCGDRAGESMAYSCNPY